MPRQLSAVALLVVYLVVNLPCGSQIRAKVFPEIRDYLQPTTAATVGTTEKTSLPQSTSQAATTSKSENATTYMTIKTPAVTTPVTTKSPPSTSPIIHTLLTTQATSNISQTAPPVTEATISPSSAPPHSQPSTVTPPAHTTVSSHTSGKTTQPCNQTTLPTTLSTAPRNSTASQRSTQPTRGPGTTTAMHNATQTASPATRATGPTLAPQPSTAKTGIYQVLNGSKLCLKAEMGIELIVQDKASVFSPLRYFNVDPNVTQASGNCGFRKSSLLLTFQGGFVNFTFTKDENSYYISEVGAYLTVSNPEKIYQGLKSTMMMFETLVGHSFKCVSEQNMKLSNYFQLKTMNVQLQVFDFEGDDFGNADECFSDRNRREIPVAVGLSFTGLLVVLLTACLVARKRPSRGYERIKLPEIMFVRVNNEFLVDECTSDYTIVLPVIGAIVLGLCAVGLIVYGLRLRRESSGYQRI